MPALTPAAARDAAQRQVFVREVDEAVRQDEMLGAMKRYGLPIAVAVLVALGGLGAFLWWQNHNRAEVAQRGEALTRAIDQVEARQLPAADAALAPFATGGSSANAAAAAVLRGAIAEQRGDAGGAARDYAAVAGDAAAPKAYRDLATLRDVAVRFDALPPQQAIDRLKPLAVPGSAWFGNAGELLGIAYLKSGQRELAGPLFAAIARDEKTPGSLRRRARQLAGLLGTDALDDVAGSPAGDAGAGVTP